MQFHKIQFNLDVAKNIGNRDEQCENVQKKLKGINRCCFKTFSVKIWEKQKISDFKGCF